jgi:hypothetical protein
MRTAPFPPFSTLPYDLLGPLDAVRSRLGVAVMRLETYERDLAALPGSAWERSPGGPAPGEVAALGAQRRRILREMWADHEAMTEALGAMRLAAARAVVRERCFEEAIVLVAREREWGHFDAVYAACIRSEHALLRLDARLGGMRPEERAKVLADLRAGREALAGARPQIALLPGLPAEERIDLARRLREALDTTRRPRDDLFRIAVEHGLHPGLRHLFPAWFGVGDGEDAGAQDDGRSSLPARVVRWVQGVPSRLRAAWDRRRWKAVMDLHEAWFFETRVLEDAIAHHVPRASAGAALPPGDGAARGAS